MKKLHPTQQQLIEILKSNSDEPLTIRELQDILEVSSPSLIHHHIRQLISKGYICRHPSNPQDYQILADSPDKSITYLNIYGMAQCGPKGSVLDGNPVDRIRISSKALGIPSKDAFAVKARGASMKPKINPGDIVIARKNTQPNNGDVVVCVNKGEVLIKKIQIISTINETAYNLLSFNIKYPAFLASDDFHIEGVVKSILSYSV